MSYGYRDFPVQAHRDISMNAVKLNVVKERIRSLNNDKTYPYPEFFDLIAQQAPQGMITADTIQGINPGAPRWIGIDMARKLAEVGAGKFVTGRRGSPTRLVWNMRSDSVGQVARGDHDQLVPLSDEDNAEDEGETDENAVGAGNIVHSFHLRPEQTIHLQLPSDLSRQEASRLSDFIKSLPFD